MASAIVPDKSIQSLDAQYNVLVWRCLFPFCFSLVYQILFQAGSLDVVLRYTSSVKFEDSSSFGLKLRDSRGWNVSPVVLRAFLSLSERDLSLTAGSTSPDEQQNGFMLSQG